MATRALTLFVLAASATPAFAQRASDNAITAAEDAFGTSIGNETIGLYSPNQVRGFSPVTAGNVRIEGVYIDRQGPISPRLVSSSMVRVGLSAQGYPFPAPTGIVDYRLREVGARPLVSVVAGSFAYGAPTVEIDAQLPIAGRTMGVAAGLSWAREEYYDGSDARYIRAALVPRWRPRDGIEVTPFYSVAWGKDEQVAPTVLAAGNVVPPDAPRRRYFGQQWAAKNSRSINAGAIVKARLGADWLVKGGGFRSIFNTGRNFTELFTGTTAAGDTTERVIADPGQRYASTSGELRVSRSLADGPRLHTLLAGVRARSLDSHYGGAAAELVLGPRQLGVAVRVPEPPTFAFGRRTHDHVRQTTLGLAYQGRWKGVGEVGIGLQRADYQKTTDQPDLPRTGTTDRPWLLNADAAAYLTARLAMYASYTRGLEESGIAPANAANRNEALPAIRTRQVDGGIRWSLPGGMKLVAGVFDVTKPYFNTDERNIFTVLGEVRHRGAELSLAGAPTDRLSLIAGAVLMRPRVTGEAVTSGRIGSHPLNQPARTLRGNAEYRPAFAPGFSVDLAISSIGSRYASRDNLVKLKAYTLVDVGARYRFNLGKTPATLRIQMQNIGDTFAWNIVGSNSYGLMDKRRIIAFVAADF